MKTVAVMPVKGREPLLYHSVNRMTRNGIHVICCGHTISEKIICESAGAVFYTCDPGTLLGKKIQFCVDRAEEMYPEYLLIMGSSDFISHNWMTEMIKKSQEGYAMVGTLGCYFLDIQPKNVKRAVFWKGYVNERKGEPGGIGRVLSRSALDMMGWNVFDTDINSSLDGSSMRHLNKLAPRWGDKLVGNVTSPEIMSVSISTYRWENMHKKWLYGLLAEEEEREKYLAKFRNDNCTIVSPSKIVSAFPELNNLFNE